MKNSPSKYEICLQVEQYDMETEKHCDEEYYNAIMIFSDVLKIAINIWSEKDFQNNINQLDWYR